MKKILLVFIIIILSSFLFNGCVPTIPAEGEGEGEIAICPIVSVTSQVSYEGKTYIKAGEQTITVTFAAPTEPISVYVGSALKIPEPSKIEVVMYANNDKTVYTGTFKFLDEEPKSEFNGIDNDCAEAYIYVDSCLECDYCKYPYIVDKEPPYLLLELNSDPCTCEGVYVDFMVETESQTCTDDTSCCNDDCTALVSGSLAVYNEDPFNECCETPCVAPLWDCTFTGCPSDVSIPLCTTSCLEPQAIHNGETYVENPGAPSVYYLVVNITDVVGNVNTYYAQFVLILNESENHSDVFCQRFYENTIYNCDCTSWTYGPPDNVNDSDDWVGFCSYHNYCGSLGVDLTNWTSSIGN